MLSMLKTATSIAVLFAPPPTEEKKPAELPLLAYYALQGEDAKQSFLLDAKNVKQNCSTCHSPVPDSKAVVCPKGHGALNVIEYMAADAPDSHRFIFTPTVTLEAAKADKLGLTLKPVGDGLRTHLKLAADAGVLVEEVAKDSVLADADVKKFDVLVAVDDVPVKEPEKAVDVLLTGVKDNKELTLRLVRQGAPKVSKIHLKPTLMARLLDETKPNETRYRIGVSLAGVDETLRQHLKIPGGEGAVVTSVEDGSAAADANIKQHDILLRWEKAPIANSEGLIEIIQKHGPKPAKVTLFREGKKAATSITPKPLPPQAEVRWVEGQYLNHAGKFYVGANPQVQQRDALHLLSNFYIANINAHAGDATLEAELSAALAQTKALQASLERLQAKVHEAKKKDAAKPTEKK